MKDIDRFLTFKDVEIIQKNDASSHTTSILMTIQSETFGSFSGAKFNNTSRNNWKPLFEVNCSKNYTKTIRLFALYFYEVIIRPHRLSPHRNRERII